MHIYIYIYIYIYGYAAIMSHTKTIPRNAGANCMKGAALLVGAVETPALRKQATKASQSGMRSLETVHQGQRPRMYRSCQAATMCTNGERRAAGSAECWEFCFEKKWVLFSGSRYCGKQCVSILWKFNSNTCSFKQCY